MAQFNLLGIVNSSAAEAVRSELETQCSIKQLKQVDMGQQSLFMLMPTCDTLSRRGHFKLVESLADTTGFVPFGNDQKISELHAKTFLLAHERALALLSAKCSAQCQITLSNRAFASRPQARRIGGIQNSKLLQMVRSLRTQPIKFAAETGNGENQLHLLYPRNRAANAHHELVKLCAERGTKEMAEISRPMAPLQFMGIQISFLSRRQVTAAELLMDISADAPVEEIRHTVAQQMEICANNQRFQLDEALLRQRAQAATLLIRIADACEALSISGVKAHPVDVPFIRTQTIPNYGSPVSTRHVLHDEKVA